MSIHHVGKLKAANIRSSGQGVVDRYSNLEHLKMRAPNESLLYRAVDYHTPSAANELQLSIGDMLWGSKQDEMDGWLYGMHQQDQTAGYVPMSCVEQVTMVQRKVLKEKKQKPISAAKALANRKASCKLHANSLITEHISQQHPRRSDKKPVSSDGANAVQIRSSGLDARQCTLCKSTGDGDPEVCGRLLNYNIDDWIHVNCALWSAECVEREDGGLMSIQKAVSRGRKLRCSACKQMGATVGCHTKNCKCNYHFNCAKEHGCVFLEDRSVFCKKHSSAAKGYDLVQSFMANRRIYVSRDEKAQLRLAQISGVTVRCGSLSILSPGEIVYMYPAFHSREYIYPAALKTQRAYWSTRKYGKRCLYHCEIIEEGERPVFKITAEEPEFDAQFCTKSQSAHDAWLCVQKIVQQKREKHKAQLYPPVDGTNLFGFNPMLLRWIEDLPGSSNCINYRLRSYLVQCKPTDALMVNVNTIKTGCARSEGFDRKLHSRFKGIAKAAAEKSARQARQGLSPRKVMPSSPSMQTKREEQEANKVPLSTQYRKLVDMVRKRTRVFKSPIQGFGMQSRAPIKKHDMVIEYVGEYVRKPISDKREEYYNSKGIAYVYVLRVPTCYPMACLWSKGLCHYFWLGANIY